ncbi:MAG: helix-turn-helix domain-containing protein [Thermodesulfobacteriota bacterium]
MAKESPNQIALNDLVERLKRELLPVLSIPRVWLNEEETARYLSLSTHLLRKWRCQGGGPEYYRVGGRILYNKDLLDAWMKKHGVR